MSGPVRTTRAPPDNDNAPTPANGPDVGAEARGSA